MSSITAAPDLTQVSQADLARFLSIFLANVVQTVNGNLDFTSNFGYKLISVNFPVANTNVLTAHGLGRAPKGYIITGASAATNVYNGNGTNSSNIGLMASAPATVGLLVF
jgi:hypothetical protein